MQMGFEDKASAHEKKIIHPVYPQNSNQATGAFLKIGIFEITSTTTYLKIKTLAQG